MGTGEPAEKRDEHAFLRPRALIDHGIENLSARDGLDQGAGPQGREDGPSPAVGLSMMLDEVVDCRVIDGPDERTGPSWEVDGDSSDEQFPVSDMARKDDRAMSLSENLSKVFDAFPSSR